MSEVVGLGLLAVSTLVPVVIARTVLAAMMMPLTRRPAPVVASSKPQQ